MNRTKFLKIVLVTLLLFRAASAQAGFIHDQCRGLYDRGIGCLDYISGGCEVGHKLHVCLRRVKRCLAGGYLPEPSREGSRVALEIAGSPAVLKVGRYRGMGAWGVVYDVSLFDFSRELPRILPSLFTAGFPRPDLVAKFVRRVSRRQRPSFYRTVAEERGQYEKIRNALRERGLPPLSDSQILASAETPEPVLLKTRIPEGLDFETGLEANSLHIHQERIRLLREQIYEPARRLALEIGIVIDLGATNLYWNDPEKRWGLFELSFAESRDNRFFVSPDGFSIYLEQARRFWKDRFNWISEIVESGPGEETPPEDQMSL